MIAHKLVWGRYNVWVKDKWVLQLFFPYIRWKPWLKELFIEADTALRVNLTERAFGLVVLGFGFGFSMSPSHYRDFRNDGTCWHGVSLKRECTECKGPAS